MIRYVLSFLLIFALNAPAARAVSEEDTLPQAKDKTALDLQRVDLEENLKAKLNGAIVPIIPETRFSLKVAINYKVYDNKKRGSVQDESGSYIELGKLGVVAPSVSDEVLRKDLISNIGYIKVTFIFYDQIDVEKTKVINDIVKKVVDVVPVWRLRIETVLPPVQTGPGPALQKISPFSLSYLWFLLAGAVGFTLVFWFHRIQQELQSVKHALRDFHFRKSEPAPEQSQSFDAKAEEVYEEPTYHEEPKQAHKQPTFVDINQIEDMIQQNPERAVDFIKELLRGHTGASDLLSLLRDIVAKPENSKVLKFLSDEEMHEWNQAVSPTADSETSVRTRELVPVDNVNQAFEHLAKSMPENEEAIFEAIVRAGQLDTLELAAQNFFPSVLVMQLPAEILSTALGLFGIHQTTALILSMSEEEQEILLNAATDKIRVYVEHEIQNYSRDPMMKMTVKRNHSRYWAEFVTLVRQLLRSNDHLLMQTQPILNRWLEKKKRDKRHAS